MNSFIECSFHCLNLKYISINNLFKNCNFYTSIIEGRSEVIGFFINCKKDQDILFPQVCPEEGSYVAWKKASNCIVKLEIPADALRSSANGRKCRASKAKVLAIEAINKGDTCNLTSVHSTYDINFFYTIGETVEVKDFCRKSYKECAPGIHHFITRKEAEEYLT